MKFFAQHIKSVLNKQLKHFTRKRAAGQANYFAEFYLLQFSIYVREIKIFLEILNIVVQKIGDKIT
jgi:hypothetical protein